MRLRLHVTDDVESSDIVCVSERVRDRSSENDLVSLFGDSESEVLTVGEKDASRDALLSVLLNDPDTESDTDRSVVAETVTSCVTEPAVVL